ncbi:MAG: hypothetical protein ABIS27_09195, partial [Longimicrobiales bacterium]
MEGHGIMTLMDAICNVERSVSIGRSQTKIQETNPSRPLLHRHALRQIPRLVHIRAAADADEVG